MIKHGEIFTHNKKRIVLLLDRVILSIDDKKESEFIFATIKKDSKSLYFCADFENYQEFKKEYKTAQISGFWHTLIINSAIDIIDEACYSVVVDDFLYSLSYTNNIITTEFSLTYNNDTSKDDDVSINHNQLTKFVQVVTNQEKIKKTQNVKNFYYALFATTWVIAYFVYNNSIQSQEEAQKDFNNKIVKMKNKISALDKKIRYSKSNVIIPNVVIQENIKNLFILKYLGVELIGETSIENVELETSTGKNILQNIIKNNPQFFFKERIEQKTIIGVKNVL